MQLFSKLTTFASAAALVLTMSACSTPEDSPTTAPAGSDAPMDSGAPMESDGSTSTEALDIGLILLQGDTYFQNIQSAVEEAVAADGGTVTAALSNGDPALENQVARSMIQKGVDAVLMQPTADEASLATMKAIKDAGITLICYGNCIDATADPANVDGVIQSDNTALGTGTGEVAVEYIKENFGEEVSIAILNCDVASACKLRKSGFLETLEAGGITATIVDDQEGFLVDKATPVAANLLTANPDVDMFWASNDGGTAGAVIGTKGSNKPIFGTDISVQIAQYIVDPEGVLLATTGQDAVGTAQGAYDMAKKVIAGEELEEFAVELPGITYTQADPASAQEYIENN